MDYPVPSMHLTIVGQQVKVLPVSLLVCSTQGCVSCPLASQEGYTAVPCLVTRRLHPSSLGLAAQVLALCSRLLPLYWGCRRLEEEHFLSPLRGPSVPSQRARVCQGPQFLLTLPVKHPKTHS